MRANLMPSAEPWPAGLTTIGNPSRVLDARERLGRAQLLERGLAERVEVGRRDAGVAHRVLGEHLVGAADARRRPRAGVRDPDHLEQLLHGPVLAARPVQRDERDIGVGVEQLRHQLRPGVDRHDLVAEPLQAVLHPRAGAQRHRPLERAAALQHRDPLAVVIDPGAGVPRMRRPGEAGRRRPPACLPVPPKGVRPPARLPYGVLRARVRGSRRLRFARRRGDARGRARTGERSHRPPARARLADPPDPLADVVLGEPEKFSRIDESRRGRRRRRRGRGRTRRLALQCPRQQVGRVDVVGASPR